MPDFTDAPLPLLYGWVTTCAPARRARSPVPSVEPSSTTMICCHAAAARSSVTTDSIDPDSSNAGMITLTDEGSATRDGCSSGHVCERVVLKCEILPRGGAKI